MISIRPVGFLAVFMMASGFGATVLAGQGYFNYRLHMDLVKYNLDEASKAIAIGDLPDADIHVSGASGLFKGAQENFEGATVFGIAGIIVMLTGAILAIVLYRSVTGRRELLPLPRRSDVVGSVSHTPKQGVAAGSEESPSPDRSSSNKAPRGRTVDVFVSYAREEQDFVRQLIGKLSAEGREAWVDWKDIPPTVDWMQEVRMAIDAAEALVFVISPDSARSKACLDELDHAVSSDKRIIPILRHEVPDSLVPPAVAGLNWISFRETDIFDDAFEVMTRALDLDLDWTRFHTRLLVRAKEWNEHDADPSYLLAGSDLHGAQNWLTRAMDRQPRINSLQTAYVAASQHESLVRQRRQMRGFYLASIAYGLLQPAVTYTVAFDGISEAGLVSLSPLWILGLTFGGSGLLMSRPTLFKSAGVASVSAVLLLIFYLIAWPYL